MGFGIITIRIWNREYFVLPAKEASAFANNLNAVYYPLGPPTYKLIIQEIVFLLWGIRIIPNLEAQRRGH